jgi:hypothetical protein
MVTLLNTQIDFRHPVDKRGSQRKLALDDYAGSFFIQCQSISFLV